MSEQTNYKLEGESCPECGGPLYARHSRKTGDGFASCGQRGCGWADFERSDIDAIAPRDSAEGGGGGSPSLADIVQRLDRIEAALSELGPATSAHDDGNPF